jgi:PEP-CTERM motif
VLINTFSFFYVCIWEPHAMIASGFKLLTLSLVIALSAARSQADIIADFTHDTFFAGHTAARNALQAAISDINAVLFSNFNQITAAQDSVTGVSGITTATFNHKFGYTNPTTGGPTIDYNGGNTAIAANEIRIFVGMQNLTGTILGQGGPGAIGFGLSGGGSPADWVQAVTNAQNASNAIYLRGGQGPVIAQISGSSTLGGTTANYTLKYGNSIGNLWFDRDTNNNGTTDTNTELEAFWHFDHTTAVASSKYDFYSVAVHEVMHAIGYGTSWTWDQKRSGTNWTGANVIGLLGSGNGVVSSDGAHVASHLNSVMNPSISNGQRKQITELDKAFLRDLGFITAVPEPGSMLLAGLAMTYLIRSRRRTMQY